MIPSTDKYMSMKTDTNEQKFACICQLYDLDHSGSHSECICIRFALLWDFTQRRAVILYRRFGTTYRSHLQVSRNQASCLERGWVIRQWSKGSLLPTNLSFM